MRRHRREDGQPCVLEFEMVEPKLFLGFAGGTAGRLALAILND